MKSSVPLILFALAGVASCRPAQTSPEVVAASEVGVCPEQSLLGYVPDDAERDSHRRFAVPAIAYPFGTLLAGDWGLDVTFRVDATGRVTCYRATDRVENPFALNPQRRAAIQRMSAWRYAPFLQDGRPVAAVVSEQVDEYERPGKRVALPDVPLERAIIALERSGCYGTCPSYRVEIRGNGDVTYHGDGYVDVTGEHRYRVPVDEVLKLVDSLRNKDLWSLRRSYRAAWTDNPTYTLTLRMGDQTHQIEDYIGRRAGMPEAVSQFEAEVDAVARSAMWIHLSQEGVSRLESEGFDFTSTQGARLLARAVANEGSRDDAAMRRVLALGAPIDGDDEEQWGFRGPHQPLVLAALLNGRVALLDPLIARGALATGGRPDQAKIDAAFRAAIAGGRLAAVQAIWAVAGTSTHPSLTFTDLSDNEKTAPKQSPVTLLLDGRSAHGRWEGRAIAQWLVAHGCNLKSAGASGDTLLHIATRAGDAPFVRYLLDQGLDPSAQGAYGLPALGSAESEDIAMLLLEAGTRMDDSDRSFRRYAQSNHWQRVIAWLDAHDR